MKVLNSMLLLSFASLASARVGGGHRFLPAANGHGIPGEYVVLFGDDTEPQGVLQGLINGGQAQGIGTEVLQVYEHAVKGFAVRMNLNALVNALKHIDGVTIEENQIISVDSVDTPVASWGVDRVDQRTVVRDNRYSYERDGSNVDVYILDTGIHLSHEDFGVRAHFGVDFTGEGESDDSGHGTHVAGKCDLLLQCIVVVCHFILISYLPYLIGTVGGTTYGIAKNVNLIAVKVLDATGSGTLDGVIAGIDWVVGQSRPNGAVANLSLTAAQVIVSINDAVNAAVAAGVVVVVAGGNSNTVSSFRTQCDYTGCNCVR
jgi:subtilisin family serine protease